MFMNNYNDAVQVYIAAQEKNNIEKVSCTNFQIAIKDTVLIGQCFGLNPVLGVCEKDAENVRFKFKSWRCAYTFISILLQSIMTTFFIISVCKSGLANIHSGTELIFYCLNLLTTIIFLDIAMKWPKLCIQIAEMEAIDPTTDSKLRLKFNVLCFVALTLAFVEHLLSELHNISLAMSCEPDMPVYEAFMRQTFSWLFDIIPYNIFFAILIHVLQIQLTFNWSFNDLFLICISIYLTSRLEQINQKVVAAKDKNLCSSFWATIRKDYNKVTYLVRYVDNIIGGVIFISFANNLFFVCAQLLHTLAGGLRVTVKCKHNSVPDKRFDIFGYGHSIYFAYSLFFLILRSLAVMLMASRVHLASLKPAFALYDVSSATYCVEIERLLNKIHRNTVALTGLNFFDVKREIILTIAGTIVTYEMVLLQFTGVRSTSSSST